MNSDTEMLWSHALQPFVAERLVLLVGHQNALRFEDTASLPVWLLPSVKIGEQLNAFVSALLGCVL